MVPMNFLFLETLLKLKHCTFKASDMCKILVHATVIQIAVDMFYVFFPLRFRETYAYVKY